MPELRVESGPQKDQTFLVRPPGPVHLGRDLEADFPLFDRRSSRRHLRIEFLDEGYRLTDLRSRAGTRVNDKKVESTLLAPGDRILVGETQLVFASDQPPDSLVGKDLAGYTILERVGSGGMGIVYRAMQRSLDRIVALKVLSGQLTRDQEFCRLFVEEARSAGELSHPNVVRVYDVNMTSGVLYYAMEFMAHGSVADLTRRRFPLSMLEAVRIALDACEGLEFAHSRGIIHRDVKPANLMVHESGAVKIGDLGIAARLNETSRAASSRGFSGSPHYMSPEQVLGRPTDARSDIYSLGATLFEMLAGAPPFRGETVKDVIFAHVRNEPPSLASLCPAAPSNLVTVVRSTLAKNPESRPQTARALAEMLGDIHSELVASHATEATIRPRRWTRRVFSAFVLAAVLVAGVGAGSLIGHMGLELRNRKRRLAKIRRILAAGRRALGAGDLAQARKMLEELRASEGSPDEWDFLRKEISAFENAIVAVEEGRPREPTAKEPDPKATDPGTTDPSHTDPSHTDPSHTDPSTTDPSHTDPSHTDPSHTEPGTKELSPTDSRPKEGSLKKEKGLTEQSSKQGSKDK